MKLCEIAIFTDNVDLPGDFYQQLLDRACISCGTSRMEGTTATAEEQCEHQELCCHQEPCDGQ